MHTHAHTHTHIRTPIQVLEAWLQWVAMRILRHPDFLRAALTFVRQLAHALAAEGKVRATKTLERLPLPLPLETLAAQHKYGFRFWGLVGLQLGFSWASVGVQTHL